MQSLHSTETAYFARFITYFALTKDDSSITFHKADGKLPVVLYGLELTLELLYPSKSIQYCKLLSLEE